MSHFGDLIGKSSSKKQPTVIKPEPVVEEKPLDFDRCQNLNLSCMVEQ